MEDIEKFFRARLKQICKLTCTLQPTSQKINDNSVKSKNFAVTVLSFANVCTYFLISCRLLNLKKQKDFYLESSSLMKKGSKKHIISEYSG